MIQPWRWALAAFAACLLCITAGLLPYEALRVSEHHADLVGCRSRENLWDTLDAIIVKVDRASPGVRAQYEPLLKARPTC